MQTSVLWGVVGILVVGIGIAVFTMKGESEPEETTNQDRNETMLTGNDPVEEEGAFSGTGTLNSLFGMGDSFFCTYTYSDTELGNGEGTGYFDGERMRVEGTYMQNGTTYQTHMINDGMKMYSWSDSAQGSFAFVMDIPEESENGSAVEVENIPNEPQGTEALSEDVTYDCKKWRPDNSVFVPPSDINFVDLEAMMQGSFEGMMLPQ